MNQNRDGFDRRHIRNYPEGWVFARISDDEQSISVPNGGSSFMGTAYLQNVVNKGIHIWTIKCEEIGGGQIGIKNNDHVGSSNYFYEYVDYGIDFIHGMRCKKEYISVDGPKIKTGDIIGMKVDFTNLSLSFQVNNKDWGKVINIEDNKYRALVAMWCASFNLISYQKIY